MARGGGGNPPQVRSRMAKYEVRARVNMLPVIVFFAFSFLRSSRRDCEESARDFGKIHLFPKQETLNGRKANLMVFGHGIQDGCLS